MRIALVSHTFVHWTGPYATQLEARGHSVRVFSLSRDVLDGVEVEYVGDGTPERSKFLAHLARVRPLRAALRRYAPDVVFAPYLSSNGMVAALAWRGPLVVSARGGDVLVQAGYLPGGGLHRRMIRFVCSRASVVHAVSDELADALATLGVPRRKIRCFPVGVDTDRFSPARGTASDSPLVVCTRRQEAVYANATIVAALAAVRDSGVPFRATLLGGGDELEPRREQVRALGLDGIVTLPGQVTRDDVCASLRKADVYVSASTSDGTSSSLLEALACGVLPVVSDIPANRGWVEDGVTGLLFAPGDDAGLAVALRRALADPTFRAEAGRRNRDRVLRDGDMETNMTRMAGLLAEAVGSA